jgi:hypothetical protein
LLLTVWVRALAAPEAVVEFRPLVNVALVARWIVKLLGLVTAFQVSAAL